MEEVEYTNDLGGKKDVENLFDQLQPDEALATVSLSNQLSVIRFCRSIFKLSLIVLLLAVIGDASGSVGQGGDRL